jgi:hypothetical protein
MNYCQPLILEVHILGNIVASYRVIYSTHVLIGRYKFW